MLRFLLTLGTVFVVLAIASSPASAQEQPFDGKFISIVKKSNPVSSVDLEKVEVKTLGGKSFLVGIGADTPDNWQKGRVVWVALDDVSDLTVFPTLDELRKAGVPQESKKDGGVR